MDPDDHIVAVLEHRLWQLRELVSRGRRVGPGIEREHLLLNYPVDYPEAWLMQCLLDDNGRHQVVG